jgi:AcrR family transcriptional regulator
VATRGRLLDAALDCLARDGYAGTTTAAVVQRAGASRGAFLHHFPTRAALLAAAAEHLYEGLREGYERAFAALPGEVDRLDGAIALLWRAFLDPRLAATLELFVAARVDPELRAALAPVAAEHHHHVTRLARSSLPDAAGHPRFEAMLGLVIDALQGMAVRRGVRGDGASTARDLEDLARLVARELDVPRRRRGRRR